MERRARGVVPHVRTIVRSMALAAALAAALVATAAVALADPTGILPAGDLAPGMKGYGLSDLGDGKGVRRFEVEIVGPAQELRAEAGPDPRARPRRHARQDRDHRRHERQPDLRRRQADRRARLRVAVLARADLRHHADPEHARHPQGPGRAARPDRRRGDPRLRVRHGVPRPRVRGTDGGARPAAQGRGRLDGALAASASRLAVRLARAGKALRRGGRGGRMARRALGRLGARRGRNGDGLGARACSSPARPSRPCCSRATWSSPRPGPSRGSTAIRCSPSGIPSSRWGPWTCRWRAPTS